MPIDFPTSPTEGQVYTYLGKSWVYNGTAWDAPKALSEIGAVQTFANAAARTAAIPTPTEGIVSYLVDTNALELYNNGWNVINPSSGNYVLNSNMTVLQRGSVGTFSTTRYVADQWRVGRATSAVGGTWSINSPTTLAGFKNAINIIRDAGNTSTAAINLTQPFENAGFELRGKTVTLSFYANPGSNYSATDNNLSFGVQSSSVSPDSVVYNTGGLFNSGNADFFTATSVAQLGPSWRRHSATFTIPTTANAFLIFFSFTPVGTAGANDFYRITGVQLEEGPVATTYKPNGASYQAELAACQRYYVALDPNSRSPIGFGYVSSSTQVRIAVPVPVEMRTSPTITPVAGYTVISNGSPSTDAAISATDTYGSSVFFICTVTGFTQNHTAILNILSNFEISAEL
jgi:hypothetical protein